MDSKLPGERILKTGIILSAIMSGLMLAPLMPIGFQLGLTHPWFKYTFFGHLGLQALALTLSSTFFFIVAKQTKWGIAICSAVSAVPLTTIIIMGLLPITSRDALIHHLAVPQWWIESGAVSKIAWHEWSYYPMLINMGFTGFLSHGLAHLTPLYHASFLVILAASLGSFFYYRNGDAETSFFAFFLTLSMPLCIKLASSPLVDLGLGLFSALTFLCLVRWAGGASPLGYQVLTGIALGLALSCKLNGILFFGVLSLIIPILGARAGISFGRILFASLIIGIIALAIYSPWLARNMLWTGNPVFPMFKSTFGAEPSPFSVKALKPLIYRIDGYHETPWDILLIPLRMLFSGQDDNPRQFDGVLTPLFLLSIIPLFRRGKDPWIMAAYYLCTTYFLIAILMSPARVRYLIPLLGPAVLLSAYGCYYAIYYFGARFKIATCSILILSQLTFAGLYCFDILNSSEAFAFIQSKITADDYLTKRIDEYPMAKYVNENLDSSTKVYFLCTGNRYYYYRVKTLSSGYFCAADVTGWIKGAPDARQISLAFLQRGVTHILAHRRRSVNSIAGYLSEEEKRAWNDFQRVYLTPMHTVGEYSLWKLEQEPNEIQSQPE